MKTLSPEVGYRIEEPAALVPWDIIQDELPKLFPDHSLKRVTDAYHTMCCVSLSGLTHRLGFHFEKNSPGRLRALELFRDSYPDLNASYDEFQRHLEMTFGPPHETSPGDEDRPTCAWNFGAVQIVHLIYDRFGPEEHVRLRKTDRSA